jgi:hypothetical protein
VTSSGGGFARIPRWKLSVDASRICLRSIDLSSSIRRWLNNVMSGFTTGGVGDSRIHERPSMNERVWANPNPEVQPRMMGTILFAGLEAPGAGPRPVPGRSVMDRMSTLDLPCASLGSEAVRAGTARGPSS